MLRPFPHPVACCCVLLALVEHKFETGQTFSYVQTDATTPNNLGSCWLTMLRRPSARSLTFSAVPRFEWQTRVAKEWKSSVKKFSCVVNLWANDVTSPINAGSCWPKMLRPFSRGFSLDSFMSKAPCKRTKHCWPTTLNMDGSCCIRLHEAKSLTHFKVCATTCNRVCKRTQHVTYNNVGSCWPTMLRSFARSLSYVQTDAKMSQHCWESLRTC